MIENLEAQAMPPVFYGDLDGGISPWNIGKKNVCLWLISIPKIITQVGACCGTILSPRQVLDKSGRYEFGVQLVPPQVCAQFVLLKAPEFRLEIPEPDMLQVIILRKCGFIRFIELVEIYLEILCNCKSEYISLDYNFIMSLQISFAFSNSPHFWSSCMVHNL